MKRINHNVFFVITLLAILSLMIAPPIFKHVNRIEPFVFGLPFVTFWIVIMCLSMSFTLIAWYIVDLLKGELDIDIEVATEEEKKSWETKGGK